MTANAKVPCSLQWSEHLLLVWYVQKKASPDPVFCDEQYDCVNPEPCAVANAPNQRATIATIMLDHIGRVDAIVDWWLTKEDSKEAGSAVEELWIQAMRRCVQLKVNVCL